MRAQARPDACTRLAALLRARARQPFAWGVRDCMLWAADAVHARTGLDPAHDLRGAYASGMRALRLLQAEGGLHGLLQRRFGRRLAPHETPAEGDVALLVGTASPGRLVGTGALGVVWRQQIVAQGAQGLVTVPLSSARGFWRMAA